MIGTREHNDHVCEETLHDLSFLQFGRSCGHLELRTDEDVVSTLPDSFLGGSAPCLEVLELFGFRHY
jgi:hypothetical protein